jgi:hypothetical protein
VPFVARERKGGGGGIYCAASLNKRGGFAVASPRKRGGVSKASRQGSGALKDGHGSPSSTLSQHVQRAQEADSDRGLHIRETGTNHMHSWIIASKRGVSVA